MLKYAISGAAALMFGGCGLLNPSVHSMKPVTATPSLYTTDATLRSTYLLGPGGVTTVCAEPQPDAAAQLAAKGALEGTGGSLGTDAEAKASYEYSTAIIQLAGRNSSVLIARDFLFNVCLMRSNNFMTNEQAVELYRETIELIGDIAVADKNASAADRVNAVSRAVEAGVPLSALTIGSLEWETKVDAVTIALLPMSAEDREKRVEAAITCEQGDLGKACRERRDAIVKAPSLADMQRLIGRLRGDQVESLHKVVMGNGG